MRWFINLFASIIILLSFTAISHAIENDEFLISKGKVGPITKGMTLDDLYRIYGKDSTKLVDLGRISRFTPAVRVTIPGKKGKGASMTAVLDCKGNKEGDKFLKGGAWCEGKISFYRITVEDDRFKTDKGIGVGSSVGSFLDTYKGKLETGGHSENLMALRQDIGMTFSFDTTWVGLPSGWSEDPSLVPRETRVESIYVWGMR